MKSICFLLCITGILTFGTLFGWAQNKPRQNAPAPTASTPTKQETIDWILSKIRAHGGYTNSFSLDNPIGMEDDFWEQTVLDNGQISCEQTTNMIFKGRSPNFIKTLWYTYRLQDICSFDVMEGSIVFTLKNKINIKSSLEKEGGHTTFDNYDTDKVTFMINLNSEDNLAKRMGKALRALVNFNCPPVKEAY